MQSIPIPEGQKCLFLSGGYIENNCFIPTNKDWMFNTTSYNPKKGIIIEKGRANIEELKTYYMNEKGEWKDINKLK